MVHCKKQAIVIKPTLLFKRFDSTSLIIKYKETVSIIYNCKVSRLLFK